jgi:hypothetical protein
MMILIFDNPLAVVAADQIAVRIVKLSRIAGRIVPDIRCCPQDVPDCPPLATVRLLPALNVMEGKVKALISCDRQ